jgi:hypothetical protein
MNDWLEQELARQLAPVTAPPGLWERMQSPRRPVSWDLRWTVLPAIAAVILVAWAGFLWKQQYDFRSGNFAAIRAWVKAQADIDIDLPRNSANAHVRILGVRMLRVRGLPVAAIDYIANGDRETLMVSGKDPALADSPVASRHILKAKQDGDTRLVSWNMRNENYTLTDSHGACLLCH